MKVPVLVYSNSHCSVFNVCSLFHCFYVTSQTSLISVHNKETHSVEIHQSEVYVNELRQKSGLKMLCWFH